MPAIITLAHQKGGVGKSTIAIHLANYYAHNGVRCAIVDTDVQGSVSDAFDSFAEQEIETFIDLIRRKDFGEYKDLLKRTQYELLIVDTPPILTHKLGDLFGISDLILIPMKPAVNDFFALNRTVKFVEDFLQIKPNVKTAIVLNMTVHGSGIQEDIRNGLKGTPILVLESEIGQRVDFMRCLLSVSSIFKTKNVKAKREISSLGDEIYELLQ